MRVSVIIPTHNRKKSLGRAVRSVINQTVKPDEIIVIDDASKELVDDITRLSTFGIPIILERFEESRGACAARNKGAEIAIGDILMFLDDDDSWEAEKIEKQLNIFQVNPNVGLVYTGKKVVSERNRNKILYKIKPSVRGRLYPKILYGNYIGTTSSVAVKKDLFFRVGGFDSEMPAKQDHDLWVRCCKHCDVEHDEAFNIRYTIAEDSSNQISGHKGNHDRAIKIFINKYKDEIDSQGTFGKRKIFASLYYSVAKSHYRRSYQETIKWCIRSLAQFPSLKAFTLLLPGQVILKVRQLLG